MRNKTNAKNRSEILSQAYVRSHNELQKAQNRMRALFEGSAVGLALIDDCDEILEVNVAFADTVGDPPSELVGKTLREVHGFTGVTLSRYQDLETPMLFGRCVEGRISHCVQRQRIENGSELFHVLTLIPLVVAAEAAGEPGGLGALLL